MKSRILLIEDNASTATSLQKVLQEEGYEVAIAARGDVGLEQACREQYNVVISDMRLPGLGGLELVAQLHAVKPKQPIILMTAHGTTETAIEATKLGACDYLLKPFEADELFDLVASAVASSRLMSEPVAMGEARMNRSAIIGRSRAMQAIYKEIGRVAATPATVLIRGATGTGKELIARAIYQHSDRADKPFIAVNCAAIPDTLLESELFGYEKGAFSGAVASKPGKFELADRGTLFLDEIGDVPAPIQVKLLRVLQDREFERLGGTRTHKVDVRLIAATNRDLRAALEEGTFREDLYYRLNVVAIDIPPLRERKEDIPPLATFFLRKFASESGNRIQSITPQALRLLMDYHWPGNVRELENILQRSVTLCSGTTLDAADIHFDSARSRRLPETSAVVPDGFTLEQWEQEIIREALKRANGNKSHAARALGLSRNALRYRLSQMGVADSPDAES